MRHHERRRHDFETEDTRGRRFLHHLASERAQATLSESLIDTLQHGCKECARAATWVEDIDLFGSKPIRNAKVFPQRLIHWQPCRSPPQRGCTRRRAESSARDRTPP